VTTGSLEGLDEKRFSHGAREKLLTKICNYGPKGVDCDLTGERKPSKGRLKVEPC